jgi:transposase-like protein
MSKKRTEYSENFKSEAVAKIRENKGNISQTSRELGIPMNTLANWHRLANGGTLAGTDNYSADP